jgi:hypothetical protein
MAKSICLKCTTDELCPQCMNIIGNDESDDSDDDSDEDSDDDSEDKSEDEIEKEEEKDDDIEKEEDDIEEPETNDIESLIYDPINTSDNDNSINRRIIVAPEKRITSNMLTQLEIARAIAIRAANIDAKGHDNAFIDIKGCDSAGEIAKKELYSRRSPLVLFRYVGMNQWEKFAIREMSFR